jgi:hypothetical protein
MTVAAPCVSGTYQWALRVKQSNDFNGPPGNDFTGNQPSTTVSGSCKLAFGVQPTSAAQNFKITGTPYDSTGASVTVDAVDGAGHTITTATGSVSLNVATGNAGCPDNFSGFSGNASVPLNGGEATFSSLESSLTASGCQLIASATGFTSSDPSQSFNISLGGESCGGGACPEFPTVLDNGGNTSLLSSSAGGAFTFMAIDSLNSDSILGRCAGWTNLGDNSHWHGGTINGFVETEGRSSSGGVKIFKNFVNQKAIQAGYGKNVGQQLIPICAGGQRVNPDGSPRTCQQDQLDGLGGWWGESLDTNGGFTGVLQQAKCYQDDPQWWGIVASFQDRNNTNFAGGSPPPGFSWDANPLVTSFSSCTSTGLTDPLCPGNAGTTYREFDITVPDPWDWRASP